MEGYFIDFMNTVVPGLGIGIVVVVVGWGLINEGIKIFLRLKHAYDKRVLRKKEKEEADKEFRKQMLKLVATVDDLKADVQNVQETIKTNREAHNEDIKKISNVVHDTQSDIKEIRSEFNTMKRTTDLLLKSEMEDIQAFITSEYFKWKDLGYVDVNALKTINNRYESYIAANGDTFIKGLVDELRKMDKKCFVSECSDEHDDSDDK